MRIHWSPRALGQARQIFRYIARDRPEAARGILEGLVERVDLLRDFPEQGELVSSSETGDLRAILYISYRIVYRVRPGEIAIVSVRHTRRQPEDE